MGSRRDGRVAVFFRIPPETKERLYYQAWKRRMSANALVTRIIESWLKHVEGKGGEPYGD